MDTLKLDSSHFLLSSNRPATHFSELSGHLENIRTLTGSRFGLDVVISGGLLDFFELPINN